MKNCLTAMEYRVYGNTIGVRDSREWEKSDRTDYTVIGESLFFHVLYVPTSFSLFSAVGMYVLPERCLYNGYWQSRYHVIGLRIVT